VKSLDRLKAISLLGFTLGVLIILLSFLLGEIIDDNLDYNVYNQESYYLKLSPNDLKELLKDESKKRKVDLLINDESLEIKIKKVIGGYEMYLFDDQVIYLNLNTNKLDDKKKVSLYFNDVYQGKYTMSQ